MPPSPHSAAFRSLRDRIIKLDDQERARLARLLGAIGAPQGRLGKLRDILRAVAALDDQDLERLTSWFAQHVNLWGQLPRDAARDLPGYAYGDERRR